MMKVHDIAIKSWRYFLKYRQDFKKYRQDSGWKAPFFIFINRLPIFTKGLFACSKEPVCKSIEALWKRKEPLCNRKRCALKTTC